MNPTLERVLGLLRKHLLLLLVAVLFVCVCVAYMLGYRPGPGLTLVRAGTLVLTGVPKGGTVYADETRRAVSTGRDVRIALEPGSHSIIVDVKGNNPWSDVVNIAPRIDTKIVPIEVPLTLTATPVDQAQGEQANKLLVAYQLPDEQHPLVMENGTVNVYVLQNRVVASPIASTTPPAYLCVGGTCATTVIFAPVAPLRAVLPYPGRTDAIIISYSSTLAVLELNPLKPQFFAPLMQGIQPAAVSFDATHIAVRDAGKTFLISF